MSRTRTVHHGARPSLQLARPAARGSRPEYWLLITGLGLIFFLLWAGVGVRDLPGDLLLYFDYANHVKDGHVPYRDFPLEYPPLALAPILVPFAVSHAAGGFFRGFEALFALEMYLLALGCGVIVWRMLPRVLPDTTPRERYLRLGAYVLAFPLLGQLPTTRLDLFPVALVMLALILWVDEREGAGWLVLALAVAAKLFPAVLAPLFALDLLLRQGWRSAAAGVARFCWWCALLFLPALLVDPRGVWFIFDYHSRRGVQLESFYANGVLLWHRLTGFEVVVAQAWGAFEAVSAWTDALRVISSLVTLALLALVYLAYARAIRPDDDAFARGQQLVLAATAVLGVTIVSGKVLSPQFLLWLVPLVALLPGPVGRAALALFLPTLALTQYIFPNHYGELQSNSDALALAALTARNLALLAVVVVVGYGLWGRGRAVRAEG